MYIIKSNVPFYKSTIKHDSFFCCCALTKNWLKEKKNVGDGGGEL